MCAKRIWNFMSSLKKSSSRPGGASGLSGLAATKACAADQLLARLDSAPLDDEGLTAADRKAVAKGREAYARGDYIVDPATVNDAGKSRTATG